MSLRELLDDRNNPDFRRGVLAMKALLPSLDFEKEGECKKCNGDGLWGDNDTHCEDCDGIGTIRTPLELEDMGWNALLIDLDKSGYILTTKSGERIVRKEVKPIR